MKNRAASFLEREGETIDDWDGMCLELADRIISPLDDILYVEGEVGWRYHAAALIDGLVHDAWCDAPEPLPPREWLVHMFGESAIVTVSMNGDDFYTGPVRGFQMQPAPAI